MVDNGRENILRKPLKAVNRLTHITEIKNRLKWSNRDRVNIIKLGHDSKVDDYTKVFANSIV